MDWLFLFLFFAFLCWGWCRWTRKRDSERDAILKKVNKHFDQERR